MLIISDDNYFKLGLSKILKETNIDNLVIFDTGKHLYLFKDNYLLHSDDPVQQWLYLNYFSLNKNETIKNITSIIKKDLWKSNEGLQLQITEKECLIIQLLMTGFTQKQIGKNADVTEKMVSRYKHKVLGIKHEKNIITLFKAIHAWCNFQEEIRPKLAA